MTKEDREKLLIIRTKVRLRCLPKRDAEWLWRHIGLYTVFPNVEDRQYIYGVRKKP